jgi:hypothetical protein
MHAVPASLNPYSSGQVITPNDCATVAIDPVSGQATATVNGNTTTSSWANNLAVACGNNANPYLPFAGIGTITRKDQTASSNYNAIEATIRHNIGGLELNAAYTFSHSIDDSSDNNDLGFVDSYNLNAYRASSDFDQRHNFTIAYVYDIPGYKGRGVANALLGGWQWSGITLIQSGSPFSVYNLGNGTIAPSDNAGVANNIATGFSYPDIVGNPKSGTSGSPLAGFQPGFGSLLYNPSAFVAPTGLTFGDAGRNILRNPWRENFDMALIKHFAVSESKYFEFRAEAFNVFNHTEFSYLGGDAGSAANNANGARTAATEITCYGGTDNSAGDPSCGGQGLPLFRANSAHLARILQLGLKFIF